MGRNRGKVLLVRRAGGEGCGTAWHAPGWQAVCSAQMEGYLRGGEDGATARSTFRYRLLQEKKNFFQALGVKVSLPEKAECRVKTHLGLDSSPQDLHATFSSFKWAFGE